MNGVECLVCGKTIVSTHRHHFVSCDCPEATRVYVDGGRDYNKRLYNKESRWRELGSGKVCTGEGPQ